MKKIQPVQAETKQKIVVGINSLTVSQYPAYSNHIQLFYNLGKKYPNIDLCLVNPPRMSIDRMRNVSAEVAMEIGASHLLFIDDDVLLPSPFDFLNKLLNLNVDIAAADVLVRGYPFDHMLFRPVAGGRGLRLLKTVPKKKGPLRKLGAVGFSCALIKTSLLMKMQPPYFVTGVANTEDVYFCVEAQKHFPETTIAADTSITCGHILWPEVIDTHNKRNFKKYYEAQFGKPVNPNNDRGRKYLAKAKAALNVA